MQTIKIEFKGVLRELQYEAVTEINEGLLFSWTNLYEGTEIITKRKYWLFGPEIKIEQPKKIFKLYGVDITSSEYTKKDIRLKLLRKLELLERGAEIERGEII